MTPRTFFRWLGSAALAILSTGCSLTWDDISSREFKVASLWTSPPEPMTVVEKSTDGYARAKAFTKLTEPSDPSLREQRIQTLSKAATGERDPLCRLAAIRTLGAYKDPRAAKTLSDVYLGNPGMSPENNAFIRQQALTSLQNNSPTEARQLFIQAAKQPAASLTGAALRDRNEILDERLTAIRALGKYPQPDSIETLVKLLETEKDVAIKTCAYESLKSATKKDIPPDGKAWREFVATGREPERTTPSLLAVFQREETSPSAPVSNPPLNAPSTTPGLFDKIQNFVRPETPAELPPTAMPAPVTAPPAAPPRVLPATLPQTVPAVPTGPNQVRTPATSLVQPASGSYRNSQGEMVVPAAP